MKRDAPTAAALVRFSSWGSLTDIARLHAFGVRQITGEEGS